VGLDNYASFTKQKEQQEEKLNFRDAILNVETNVIGYDDLTDKKPNPKVRETQKEILKLIDDIREKRGTGEELKRLIDDCDSAMKKHLSQENKDFFDRCMNCDFEDHAIEKLIAAFKGIKKNSNSKEVEELEISYNNAISRLKSEALNLSKTYIAPDRDVRDKDIDSLKSIKAKCDVSIKYHELLDLDLSLMLNFLLIARKIRDITKVHLLSDSSSDEDSSSDSSSDEDSEDEKEVDEKTTKQNQKEKSPDPQVSAFKNTKLIEREFIIFGRPLISEKAPRPREFNS